MFFLEYAKPIPYANITYAPTIPDTQQLINSIPYVWREFWFKIDLFL